MKNIFLALLVLINCQNHAMASDTIETPIHQEVELNAIPAGFRDRIARRSVPFIQSYWNVVPDIRLCTDSGVSEVRLRSALGFWERLGYEFGNIIVNNNSVACFRGGYNGEIVILLFSTSAGFDFSDKLAVTQTYYHTSQRYILKAKIYINRYGAERERTLEHEIGHAMGWSHYNRRHHLMHENHNNGGHDTTGLRRNIYDDQIERITTDVD